MCWFDRERPEPLEGSSARPTTETDSRDHDLKKPSFGRQPLLPMRALQIPAPSPAAGACRSCLPYGGCGHPAVTPGKPPREAEASRRPLRLGPPAGFRRCQHREGQSRPSSPPVLRSACQTAPGNPTREMSAAPGPRSPATTGDRSTPGVAPPPRSHPPTAAPARAPALPAGEARRAALSELPQKVSAEVPAAKQKTERERRARGPRGRAGKAHAAASRRAGAARRGRGRERRSRLSANCRQPVTALRAAAGARLRRHRAGRRRGGVRGVGGAPFIFGRAAERGPGRGAPAAAGGGRAVLSSPYSSLPPRCTPGTAESETC